MKPTYKHDHIDNEGESTFFIHGFSSLDQGSSPTHRASRRKKLLIAGAIASALVVVVVLIVVSTVSRSSPSSSLSSLCPSGYERAPQDAVFFVVGDWGQNVDTQRRAANLMGRVAECLPPDFILSTGDNFYPSGLISNMDPRFKATFSDMYTAPGLQVPWYAVLGNHDYGDGLTAEKAGKCLASSPQQCTPGCCYSPVWQYTQSSPNNDLRWHLTNSSWQLPPLAGGRLHITFMDTCPFIPRYHDAFFANSYGGIKAQDKDAQLVELKALLAASLNATSPAAGWRLLVGHHPVWSYGVHCQTSDPKFNDCKIMGPLLKPLLQQYHVSAYLCGHDHDQQHIKWEDDPVHYVLSGAGGIPRYQDFDGYNPTPAPLKFHSVQPGFVAVTTSQNLLTLHYYQDGTNAPAYTVSIPLPSEDGGSD